jgi:hypothetical protein
LGKISSFANTSSGVVVRTGCNPAHSRWLSTMLCFRLVGEQVLECRL